ncbi:MAG: glycosyltransferase family 4 protein [Bradyrhizobiaceae bacterium]|nr:glycosyltransferase family 4 protein [Bradyrhizobiaceae bacterium]
MKVAINVRTVRPGRLDGIGWYTNEILRRNIEANPDVEFHLIHDRRPDPRIQYADNVVQHRLLPPARRAWLYDIWFQWRVPSLLKSINPDVFISTDGSLPLGLDIPTILVQHDLGYLAVPEQVDKLTLWYYHNRFPQCFRAATVKATVSEFSRNQIVKEFGVNKADVHIVPNAAREIFSPVSEAVKSETRQRVTNGSPYIVFVGTIQPRKNFEGLLKAFDRACSDGLEDVKLVLAGRKSYGHGAVDSFIATLGCRDRIITTGWIPDEELVKVMGSATAMVYIPHYEGFGIPIIEAMACGVPVVCSRTTALPEVAGDAALYVEDTNDKTVADAIKLIATDTPLREKLIAKGFLRSAQYSWDESANKMWELVHLATHASRIG